MTNSERVPVPPIRTAILKALRTGNKTQGELFDLTQCGSYPVLNIHLKDLIDAGEIEAYFIYRLRPSEPTRLNLLAWYRPN